MASKILVVSAEYPKMFQWKCYINLKATNILQAQSKPFLSYSVEAGMCCMLKEKDFIYIRAYISKKTLKNRSRSQSNGFLHSEFA